MKDQEDRHSCLSFSGRQSQTRMSGLLKHGTLQFSCNPPSVPASRKLSGKHNRYSLYTPPLLGLLPSKLMLSANLADALKDEHSFRSINSR